MAVLVPASLQSDVKQIELEIEIASSIPEIVDYHLDIEDGKFVKNITVLPNELGFLQSHLNLEAHLMVQRPQNYFLDLEQVGVKTLILHFESFHSTHELNIALRNARQLGFRTGVAINPNTEIVVFEQIFENIEIAMLMSVHPGWQGQKFVEDTYERITELRQLNSNVIIEVDGGVKLENFESLIAHGAERLVVGSGIWKTPDPRKTIQDFLLKLK